ncbi:hypothetical protein CY34DRAFT_799998 [Suillus luteus UH-Slu-Lm8-n1]|uniref:Unplaced genomic scaffold CY34scaffold_23, whole genome shotgun sequence n=1 Tax=Suillus luteus UH-Slu-Lm8-n1 TaxID=930992 RepID=A0A0D0AYM6_9AGAM|nr:hypothetical protein CY34DRAFT_799998 [Suillus luteus UH-Slu-Lm8-n1]
MRTSALLTLFFSFFFVIEMVFCIPLSIPARSYVPGAREILGSQNKRITDPVTSPIEMFLRKLARPGLREMQLQIDDYCSKFPCPTPRGISEI